MIGVVIGASEESIFAIQTAKKMGLEVIAFDGDKNAKGLSYADRCYIIDIRSPKLIIEAFNKDIPDIVLPVPIGRYLISAGTINDYYNLKGVTRKAADLCTDKYAFHQVLSKKGLRNITCHLVSSLQTFYKTDFSYPVIVKPRFGAGSRDVFEAENKTILFEKFCKNSPYKEDFIIEDAVAGEEYGIDAAIIEGTFYLVLVRKKLLTKPPMRQCVGYISVKETKENKEFFVKLKDYLKEVIQTLEINNSIFHADIIKTQKEFFIIELSARPSGHRLHNIFTPLAANINMIQEYISYVQGKEYCFIPKETKQVMIRYFDFENCIVTKKPSVSALKKKFSLLRYECNIGKEPLLKVTNGHSIMNRGYFILEGDTQEQLKKESEDLLSCFETKPL